MPLFLNPRFAFLMVMVVPLAGGAMVHPQGAVAFVLGAWAGWLIVAPAAYLTLWVLGLRSLPQLLKPLIRLPILLGLTALLIYLARPEWSGGAALLGGGGLLWWARRGGTLI